MTKVVLLCCTCQLKQRLQHLHATSHIHSMLAPDENLYDKYMTRLQSGLKSRVIGVLVGGCQPCISLLGMKGNARCNS